MVKRSITSASTWERLGVGKQRYIAPAAAAALGTRAGAGLAAKAGMGSTGQAAGGLAGGMAGGAIADRITKKKNSDEEDSYESAEKVSDEDFYRRLELTERYAFDESKVKRDEGGKFSKKEGASGGSTGGGGGEGRTAPDDDGDDEEFKPTGRVELAQIEEEVYEILQPESDEEYDEIGKFIDALANHPQASAIAGDPDTLESFVPDLYQKWMTTGEIDI